MSSGEAELECRVCRMGGEDDRPLYNPCLCSGSIGLVHQDCLEAWLAHSKKDTCELCFAKYQFIPQYAEDTPQVIPLLVLLKSTLKIAVVQWLPYLLRVLLAIVVWIGGIPLITAAIYMICMRREVEFMFNPSYANITTGIKCGLILDGIVALSLLILMSFTDFLRFHWGRGGNARNNGRAAGNGNNANANAAPQPGAPAPQAPLDARGNNPPNGPNLRNIIQEGNVVLPRRRPDPRVRDMRRRREDEQRLLLQQLKELEEEIMKRTDELTEDLEPETVSSPSSSPQVGLRRRKPVKQPSEDSTFGEKLPLIDEEGDDDDEEENEKRFNERDYRRISASESHDQGDSSNLRDSARFLYHTGSLDLQQSELQHLKHLKELKEQYDKLEEMSELLRQEEENEMSRHQDTKGQADEEGPVSPAILHKAEFYLDTPDRPDVERDESSEDSDDKVLPPMEPLEDAMNEAPEEPVVAVEEENVEELVRRVEMLRADERPGNNNNNNNLDPDDMMNEFAGNNPGAGDVALELRVAILELIGIDGPFYVMFRNAAYIGAFTSLYIFTFTFFPFIIGRNATYVIGATWQRLATSYPWLYDWITSAVVSSSLWRLLQAVQEECLSKSYLVVYFSDFLYIGLGYTTITSVIFTIDFTLFYLGEYVWKRMQWLSLQFHSLGLIVKIAVLLQMRIFVLPITLGSLVLSMASHHLFHYTITDWIPFMSQNTIGMIGLMWICGITFMLTMTISVLQLREVLHPNILAKWIKPQEANGDLIQSLVTESGFVHTKRIITSLSVYILLLCLLIYTPFCLYHYVLHDRWQVFSSHFYSFHFYYYIPEIQVPVELLLCHICFLSILEKKKDQIGHAQYHWMTWICSRLNLSRTLLPLPILKKIRKVIKRKPSSTEGPDAATTSSTAANVMVVDEVDYGFTASQSVHTNPNITSKLLEETGEIETVEEVLVLGKPMVRPPPGWDSRVSHNASRWSWINEEPSLVERNVAVQTYPRLFTWRLLVFLLLSWLLLINNTLTLILLPLSIGRFFTKLLCIPTFIVHDPLNFAFGLYVLDTILTTIVKLKLHQSNPWHLLKSWMSSIYQSIKSQRKETLIIGWRIIAIRVVTYTLVGLFVCLLSWFYDSTSSFTSIVHWRDWVLDLVAPVETWQHESLRYIAINDSQVLLYLLSAPVCGMVIVEVFTLIMLHTRVGSVVVQTISLGTDPPLVDVLLQAKLACNNVLVALFNVRHELQQANLLVHLKAIENLIVMPTFSYLVLRGVVLIQVLTLGSCWVLDRAVSQIVISRYLGIHFMLSVLYLLLIALPLFLYYPMKFWIQRFVVKIRDENYLIGKRLVNTTRNAENPVNT